MSPIGKKRKEQKKGSRRAKKTETNSKHTHRQKPLTNAEGLAKANSCGLANSLVGESAGAGHDANLSRLVDVAGHDANLALAGLDDAGAVWTNKARLFLLQKRVLHSHHVLCNNQ